LACEESIAIGTGVVPLIEFGEYYRVVNF